MPDDTQLPSMPTAPANLEHVLGEGLPNALRILIDDRLFERVKLLAKYMAEDTAFTPKHLRGKPQACFTVLSQALNWKLDPHFVARCNYETPGGSIGFMGSLVQAILEQSGRLIGGIQRRYVGDWPSIVGKFTKKTSSRGNEFVVPTWGHDDARGLGIILSAQLKGEHERRFWPAEDTPFYLTQCYPLNSPLWATDPQSQIFYLTVRRFANQAVPGLLGGMPFDEDALLDASERAVDITSMATLQESGGRSLGQQETTAAETPAWEVTDHTGTVYAFDRPEIAIEAARKILIAVANDPHALATAWENNASFVISLGQYGREIDAQALERLYNELKPQTTEQASRQDAEERPGAGTHATEPGRAHTEEEEKAEGGTAPLSQGASAGTTPERGETFHDTMAAAQASSTAGAGPTATTPASPSEIGRSPAEATTADGGKGSPIAGPDRTGPADAPTQQTAEKHDKWWDGASLKLDPPPVRGGGSLRNLDWKVWPVLLRPRIRQAWAVDVLNRLWRDNADNLERFGQSQGEEARLSLVADFDAAAKRLGVEQP